MWTRCSNGGSKLLKAIVVKGDKKPDIFNDAGLKKEIRELAKYQVQNRGGMHEHGTAEGLLGNELSGGDLPIKNWKQGQWDRKSQNLSGGEVLTESINKEIFCGNCVIGCGREIKIEGGPYSGIEGAGPEYETVSCLGSNLLIDDLAAVCKV